MDDAKLSFLEGKRCLIISPSFFGYETVIKRAIEKAGGWATVIDERPGNSFLVKAIVRVNSKLIGRRVERYYQSEIVALGGSADFDFILVVSPEAMSPPVLRLLKRRFPRAKFVLYMYDSLRNKTGSKTEELFPFFDRILSFDLSDCAVNPGIVFRPLFYSEEYAMIPNSTAKLDFGLGFVGTLHSDRYAICRKVRASLDLLGINSFIYLYLSDKKLYWIQKATNPALRGCTLKDVSFTPMPRTVVFEYMGKTKAMLDIQHPEQTGLTMRTIEVLGARRKLITTNKGIKEYDFYNENNICLIDREDPRIPEAFFDTPYVDQDEGVYQKYSVAGWLRDVLYQ
jgi:hypothetical protein